MQDSGLIKLSQIIYDYCGLKYQDRLATLKNKIARRISQLDISHWDYCGYLKMNPAEWDVLVEILTINETYFYREEHQLNECCSLVLPKLQSLVKNRPIRIWSAACSTGDEPYTLAMLIQESGKFPPGSVEIIGTDINKKVLQKAESGFYHHGSFAFRRIPHDLFKKYFREVDGGYTIADNIRKMVKFQHANLLDGAKLKQVGTVDVIFCRNVLIYFDQATTRQVISGLAQNLMPGGYLFLGHAESITDMGLGFQKVDSKETFYYRKEHDHDAAVRRVSG